MAEPHRLTYYHGVDDPYAHLLVQLLPDLVARYAVELRHHLVPPPEDEMAPERARLIAWSRSDAAELARHYAVEFDPAWKVPAPGLVARANAILAALDDTAAFLQAAPAVGRALWSGAGAGLAALEARHGRAEEDAVGAALDAGKGALDADGYFQGAALHYAGEWYWGIERLRYLEARLDALGLGRSEPGEALLRRRGVNNVAFERLELTGGKVDLDYYVSFRSPYTYLSLGRVLGLAERYPVRLNVKPVLPMLMRGLPVPGRKALYILGDAAREARRLGIPFGNWCDPLGPGVERWMAIFPYAEAAARVTPYLRSTFDGVWAEAIDAASDAGLKLMVERAGLDWHEARRWLGDEGWREMATRNEAALGATGLWGVPSFVLGSYAAWGQDRVWILEKRLKARFG